MQQVLRRTTSNLISLLAVLSVIFMTVFTIDITRFYITDIKNQSKTHNTASIKSIINETTIELAESISNEINVVTESIPEVRTVSVSEISVYTDLSVMMEINVDQMNEIIDYWCRYNPDSPFIDNGQMFIDASNETGLDPVYILAHAGLESGWGMSNYAKAGNFFGIGAYDYNPDNALKYGNDSVESGIINGAIWIKENYYNNGQTSLYTMRYSDSGTHDYCTSNTWMNEIAKIIKTSYSLVQ